MRRVGENLKIQNTLKNPRATKNQFRCISKNSDHYGFGQNLPISKNLPRRGRNLYPKNTPTKSLPKSNKFPLYIYTHYARLQNARETAANLSWATVCRCITESVQNKIKTEKNGQVVN
jgi:hypothetical protein